MSQPAREFIVKIVELGLWSSDFLIAHILLLILTPITLVPYADTIHATLLCKSLPPTWQRYSLFVQSGCVPPSKFVHLSTP